MTFYNWKNWNCGSFRSFQVSQVGREMIWWWFLRELPNSLFLWTDLRGSSCRGDLVSSAAHYTFSASKKGRWKESSPPSRSGPSPSSVSYPYSATLRHLTCRVNSRATYLRFVLYTFVQKSRISGLGLMGENYWFRSSFRSSSGVYLRTVSSSPLNEWFYVIGVRLFLFISNRWNSDAWVRRKLAR